MKTNLFRANNTISSIRNALGFSDVTHPRPSGADTINATNEATDPCRTPFIRATRCGGAGGRESADAAVDIGGASRAKAKGLSLCYAVPLLAACFLILPQTRGAGVVENFSYSGGNLTTVSGGAWQPWEPGAGAATVVNGAMRFDGTTDVIRTFPAVLTQPGASATISFDIYLSYAPTDTPQAYAIDLLPASAPFGDANTNYGNQLSLVVYDLISIPNPFPGGENDGLSGFDIVTGTGAGANVARGVGALTQGAWHSLRLELARGVSSADYSLYLDNGFVRNGSFVLTDPRALNAVELEQSYGSPSPLGDYALIDNLRIVPEPSAAVLMMSGLGALPLRRRRMSSR